VQLHGDESPADVRRIRGVRVIKAFRVGDDFDFGEASRYPGALLFDARVEGAYGGTGRTFDWRLLKKAPAGRPLILSGGLNPRNVREAVRLVKPYGVDASSSLERSPGKKDPKLVKEFIRNAKKI
jgi:phosphoribosylanthranilate isomerase